MSLDYQRPQILAPPEHPPPCRAQQSITVPPEVHAKTAQKHDYPSRAHRRSYARRLAAERTFSTAKDPASNDITRGWCRLMGLTPITLFACCLLVVRNQRILAAYSARQAQNAHRAAAGLPPKTRRQRRKPLSILAPPAITTRHTRAQHPATPPPPRSADPACRQPGQQRPETAPVRPERLSLSPGDSPCRHSPQTVRTKREDSAR
jgi:hypothetical protein